MNLRWPTRKSRRQCFFCHKMVEVERAKLNDWVCDASVCGQRNRYEGDKIADTFMEPEQHVQLHGRPAENYPVHHFESPFCNACEVNLQGYLNAIAAHDFQENASEAEISRIQEEIHSLHPLPCVICAPRINQIINEKDADLAANLPERIWMQALARGRSQGGGVVKDGGKGGASGGGWDWEWWEWVGEGVIWVMGFGLLGLAFLLEMLGSRQHTEDGSLGIRRMDTLWLEHKSSIGLSIQALSIALQLKSRRWKFWWSRFRFSAETVDDERWKTLNDIAIAIRGAAFAVNYAAPNSAWMLTVAVLVELALRYTAVLSLIVIRPPPLVDSAKPLPATYPLIPKPAWLDMVLSGSERSINACRRFLLSRSRQSFGAVAPEQKGNDDGPIPMDWEPTPPPSSSKPAYLNSTPQLTPHSAFNHADIATAFNKGLRLGDDDQEANNEEGKWTAWREGTAKAMMETPIRPIAPAEHAPPSSPSLGQALGLPGCAESVYDSSGSSVIQEQPRSENSRFIKAGYACAGLARLLYIVQLATGRMYGEEDLWSLDRGAVTIEFGLAISKLVELSVTEGFTMGNILQRTDDLAYALKYTHILNALCVIIKAIIPAFTIIFEQLSRALDTTTAVSISIASQVVWIGMDCILWYTSN